MAVLSRTQQNEIFRLVADQGLNALDFAWRRADVPYRGLTETLTHTPTEARFEITDAGEKFWLSWWPRFKSGDLTHFSARWDGALTTIHHWLTEVKKNHDAPDLWGEAFKARELTDAASDVGADNTPFSLSEIELLKPKLVEVEAYIQSRQPLPDDQRAALRRRFDYLLGAARRGLGRIDWLNIFASQIMQLFTDGVLRSSLFGDVMRHAGTAFGSLLKIGGRFLGP